MRWVRSDTPPRAGSLRADDERQGQPLRPGGRRADDLRHHRRPGEENDLPGALPARGQGQTRLPDRRRRNRRVVDRAATRSRSRGDRGHDRRSRRGRLRPPRGPHLLRPGRLRRRRHLQAGRRGDRRGEAPGLLPGGPPLALLHRRRRARRGRPDREREGGDREAVRPRPRLGAGPQRRAAPGARRGADPADRPLPRQGAGDGHLLPALRQLAAGAGLEPRARLPRADDDRRGLRRRRPRPLLRRGRRDARRDPEPRAAGAGAGRDGAARGQLPGLNPRQEAGDVPGGAHRRPEALRARPVRRLSQGQGRAPRTRRPRPSPRSSWESTTGAGAASPSSSAPASACRRRPRR